MRFHNNAPFPVLLIQNNPAHTHQHNHVLTCAEKCKSNDSAVLLSPAHMFRMTFSAALTKSGAASSILSKKP
jgi:hypothetical protein